MSYVELKDIRVSYDNQNDVLKNFNLSIEKGELVSLLGPSGCGKTTTLRVIAGLIQPNDGQFIVDDKDLTKVAVHKREFGMVFQSYALFPHLTIKENVAFGLKIRKMRKNIIDEKVQEALELTDLAAFGDRYPKQLSGGQRQRVALARALVIEPKLLLLDEPLSNLDAKLRVAMRINIKRIQSQLGITSIFVTHDQEECFSISDKVAVMNKGIIEQFDTPEAIYNHPKTEFVARFIGFENFFDLTKVEGDKYRAKDGTIFLGSTSSNNEENVGTIRPDDIKVISDTYDQTDNVINGKINIRTFLGKSYQYEAETSIGTLLFNASDDQIYQEGETLKLLVPQQKLIIV